MLSEGVEIVLNERKVYEVDWLEDSYKRVRFPNPKCEEFLVEVNKVLSHKLRGELDNQVKQQSLFKLLGEDYVRIHFPHHKYNPKLLEKSTPEVKENYTKEMKLYIEEQLAVTMKELGYPEDVSQVKDENKLSEFTKAVSKTFKDELDRQVKEAVESYRLRDIEVAADEANKSRRNSVSIPATEFEQSRVPAEAFVATAKVNGQVKQTALKMFKKKMLPFPEPIRKFLWLDIIKGSARKNESKGSKKSKESSGSDFTAQLKKAMKTGKLQGDRAVQSPEYKSIYSVIIDCYATTKVLKKIADDGNMLNSAHIINVINYVTSTYTNMQIFHLVPLQSVFVQEEGENNENFVVRMSNLLHLLTTNLALTTSKIFKAAEDTMASLSEADPEYATHLKKCLADRIVPVNVHEFPQECLLKDSKKSVKLWKDLYDRSKNKKKAMSWKDSELEIFGNPETFLRKWIAEAFAGILSDPELSFIWDILFLYDWVPEIFTKVALVILLLIKPWAMRAENHRSLAQVLLEEPSNLYIGDLRKAVQAVYKGKTDLKEIPSYNTNIEIVSEQKKPEPAPEEPVAEPTEDPEVVVEDGEPKPEGEAPAEGEIPAVEAEVPAEGEAVEPPPADVAPA